MSTENLRDEVQKAYDVYEHELKRIRQNVTSINIYDFHKLGNQLFSKLENLIVYLCSYNELQTKEMVLDVVSTSENICGLIPKHWKIVKAINNNIQPVKGSYITIQRFLKTYKSTNLNQLIEMFENEKLPVTGFKDKIKMKANTHKIDACMLFFGVLFILAYGLLAYFTAIDTGYKYLLLRSILGIGVGLVISTFVQGAIKTQFKFKGLVITTTSVLVSMFLFVYLFNPANVPVIP